MNWTDYFRREHTIERELRRTLPPRRAATLARQLATRPLPLLRGLRLLRQVGTPGRDDTAIVRAHQLLMQLEPTATPPLDMIRLTPLRALEGMCMSGVIFINTSLTFYRTAQSGDA